MKPAAFDFEEAPQDFSPYHRYLESGGAPEEFDGVNVCVSLTPIEFNVHVPWEDCTTAFKAYDYALQRVAREYHENGSYANCQITDYFTL